MIKIMCAFCISISLLFAETNTTLNTENNQTIAKVEKDLAEFAQQGVAYFLLATGLPVIIAMSIVIIPIENTIEAIKKTSK